MPSPPFKPRLFNQPWLAPGRIRRRILVRNGPQRWIPVTAVRFKFLEDKREDRLAKRNYPEIRRAACNPRRGRVTRRLLAPLADQPPELFRKVGPVFQIGIGKLPRQAHSPALASGKCSLSIAATRRPAATGCPPFLPGCGPRRRSLRPPSPGAWPPRGAGQPGWPTP